MLDAELEEPIAVIGLEWPGGDSRGADIGIGDLPGATANLELMGLGRVLVGVEGVTPIRREVSYLSRSAG